MTKKAIKKTSKKAKQINNPSVKTREVFRKLLTPLTTEEYKALEESIVRDGVREPLVVWKEKGVLVDGHNRLDICKEHGKRYHIVEKSFANEDDVKLWIWDNQEGKRNMTPFRRVEVVLNLKDIIAKQAKEQQRKGKGRGRKGCPKLDKAKAEQVHTDKVLAKRAGVSRNTFRHAEAIVKKMEAGKIEKKDISGLRNGKKKINSVYLKYCVDPSSKTQTCPTPKIKHQLADDIAERSKTFFEFLEEYVSDSFSLTEDRNYIYEKVIEWVSAKQAGASSQQESTHSTSLPTD